MPMRYAYLAYKVLQIQYITGTARPDKRSASGYFAFVISRRHPTVSG